MFLHLETFHYLILLCFYYFLHAHITHFTTSLKPFRSLELLISSSSYVFFSDLLIFILVFSVDAELLPIFFNLLSLFSLTVFSPLP